MNITTKKNCSAYDGAEVILGAHPVGNDFGSLFDIEDSPTEEQVPHRALVLSPSNRGLITEQLKQLLVQHHMSDEMIQRECRKLEAMKKIGYPISSNDITRFPKFDKTRKGNLAEVCLAEYLCSASNAILPVYRLHYNPNVEQSMKGDDVLAFDFSSKYPRILVGESKFRKTPTENAVKDIVNGLITSHRSGLPASLQFVADRLYEQGKNDLAEKVEDCSLQIIDDKLSLNYVGLLLSNMNCKNHIHKHTKNGLKNLVMISLGMEYPENLVNDCFDNIEGFMHVNAATKS